MNLIKKLKEWWSSDTGDTTETSPSPTPTEIMLQELDSLSEAEIIINWEEWSEKLSGVNRNEIWQTVNSNFSLIFSLLCGEEVGDGWVGEPTLKLARLIVERDDVEYSEDYSYKGAPCRNVTMQVGDINIEMLAVTDGPNVCCIKVDEYIGWNESESVVLGTAINHRVAKGKAYTNKKKREELISKLGECNVGQAIKRA